jgi:uncharacterized membrane protein
MNISIVIIESMNIIGHYNANAESKWKDVLVIGTEVNFIMCIHTYILLERFFLVYFFCSKIQIQEV